VIGRSVTAPPRVLSPRSILPPLSPHWTFISAKKKFDALLKNVISITLVNFKVSYLKVA
jgi:hypothetical protein